MGESTRSFAGRSFSGYDLIGDVHGTLDGLLEMIHRLGYEQVDGHWLHSDDRALVAVGDVIDQGPDSLGCLDLMRQMTTDGIAEMVLGNHELNLLHLQAGLREPSEPNLLQLEGCLRQLENSGRWEAVRDFLAQRPTHVLLDHGRLRVVHACWHEPSVLELPHFIDAQTTLERTADGGDLRRSVENCIKGPVEQCGPFTDASGRKRDSRRVSWWTTYPADAPFVAFGHYRFPWSDEGPTPEAPALLGPGGNAACLDFGAGSGGPLVGLRYPEREFVIVEGP